jgi:AraC-like DNA-binding protein
MTQASFLTTIELIFFNLIELYGVDSQNFKQQFDSATVKIPNPKSRTSTVVADDYFLKASSLISDPAFALKAADCWHPSNLGALGYAWLSSATLQEGLERLIRYARILGQKMHFYCEINTQSTRFILVNNREDVLLRSIIMDFTLAIIIDMCRKNTDATFHPLKVNMRRPQPKDTSAYTAYFGCPVQFDAEQDSFEIERVLADTLLPSSNRELAMTFDSILTEQLSALDKSNTIERCKHFLLQEMTSGEPTDHQLANVLGMSQRTLQRKLAEHGTSYKRLLDELRHTLAQSYLTGTQRSVNEITFLLGFSEQSAFTRAFKRWHGKSPTAYRTENIAIH